MKKEYVISPLLGTLMYWVFTTEEYLYFFYSIN